MASKLRTKEEETAVAKAKAEQDKDAVRKEGLDKASAIQQKIGSEVAAAKSEAEAASSKGKAEMKKKVIDKFGELSSSLVNEKKATQQEAIKDIGDAITKWEEVGVTLKSMKAKYENLASQPGPSLVDEIPELKSSSFLNAMFNLA